MEKEFLEILDNAAVTRQNESFFKENTRWLQREEVVNLPWNQVEYLCIVGADNYAINDRNASILMGYHVNREGNWVFAVLAAMEDVGEILSQCGCRLKYLNIQCMPLEYLDVSKMTGLERLRCRIHSRNSGAVVEGVHHCPELEALELSRVILTEHLDVSNLKKLRSLYLFPILHQVGGLYPITGFQQLVKLESLTIYGSCDCDVLDVSALCKLKKLSLRVNEALGDVIGIEHLQELEILVLGETGIRKLPEGIRTLKRLRMLNLTHQTLDTLPDWITELDLPFYIVPRPVQRGGIILCDANIKDMNMSIFGQSQEMIRQWFEERKGGNEVPLNEIKVVFLGDGEAGKSHTIARLLNDGGKPLDYTDGATPGIVIKNKEYEQDGRKIQVHFWDFGGQEILHSMHRIFLTERTLYVVLVNARDETQDVRARYWLHNIKSFAPKAKVLLVLNKMDQNPNANVNERDLKYRYENLTRIVKLSALAYDQECFNRVFRDVLLEEIMQTGYPDVNWPIPWTKVKSELEKMGSNYIRGPQYREICRNCSVNKNQKALLNWFTDLGISFCYSDDYRLENYVILRPDWITNALYIILFNKCRDAKNGLIPHSSISWILGPDADDEDEVRRVLPGVYYDWDEIRYVLEVFHKAQLSFDAGSQNEFIPMLCDPNSSPVAQQYEEDEDTLEFQMEFDYLPNNLLYQLMVDRKDELRMEHVWRTGAMFAQEETGFSAVVAIDGDKLRIFVRSDKAMHKPNTYLTMLKANVDRIWRKLGLQKPRNAVVYKFRGQKDSFDYEYLNMMQEMGQSKVLSMVLREMLDIDDILNQAAPEKLEERDKLLDYVIQSCQNIQGDMRYWGSLEDDRNNRIRDDLRMVGYTIHDQTRQGGSGSGRNPGELDIEIRTGDDKPWTIIEALRVDSGSKGDWNDHLKKLLDNYNPHGAPFAVLLTYVDCRKDKFDGIWNSFEKHMKQYGTDEFTYVSDSYQSFSHSYAANNHFIRTAQCQYACGSYMPMVYHIFVRVGS